jgi:hypothetical protein
MPNLIVTGELTVAPSAGCNKEHLAPGGDGVRGIAAPGSGWLGLLGSGLRLSPAGLKQACQADDQNCPLA